MNYAVEMNPLMEADVRKKAEEKERKLLDKFYIKNEAECTSRFLAWKEERDRLGVLANDSALESALLDWAEDKVYKKVRREYFQLVERWDAVSDSLRLSWDDVANDILLDISDKLRGGEFRESKFLLGYIGKAHLMARGKLRDEVEYSSSDVPLITTADDGDEEKESIVEVFDLDQLPIESFSVWTLCGDLIRWLIPNDQEFLLVSRLIGLHDKDTALKLTGLTAVAFKGRKKHIVQRCRVALAMLEEFRLPGEYLSETKERVEGLVQALVQTSSQMLPKSFAEAVQMAQQTHPVRLQDALHTEDTRRVRKLLLTLYRRPKPV